MHQPSPHGLLAVGGEPTSEDSAAIELLARRLTNLKTLSGVESLRMVRSLPGGGYVIAQDMGGTFRCITHKPAPPPPPPPFDGVAKDYIPMLFSGVVTKAVLRQGEGLGMRFTEQTRRRLANYDPENLGPDRAALQRFAIEYHTLVSELMPQIPGSVFTYTQYVAQRPTWYSGAMAEVMQIVGGYGRQDLPELPDDKLERARLLIPEQVMRKIREQMGNVRLPGYTGLPDKKGQFRYDYKFTNTNAVAFDSTNKPWLLRVGSAGVWAMPLPMVPATTTQAFREYMEQVGDQEIIDILDRFGGMPSGESFPFREDDFQAWKRAGVIIKVCDTADFYDHIMYSSACGWSFNSRGTEGYNTCYDYYDDEGLGYGLAYKMKLTLSPAQEDGKLPPPLDVDDPADAKRLDQYMASLYKLLKQDSPKHLAIKYKLRRVDPGQILARADGEASEGEVDYWDALELDPIASHSGSVSEVGRGYLYHGARFQFQPQIKFPEPFMGGCVSHDFLPLINGRYKESYPNCDTIMFGYYVGDDLKVVKYFRDGRSYQREIEDDYEDCMIVGSWTRTISNSSTSLMGHFYTTDIDERQAVTPSTTVIKTVGKDLGYDHTPHFAFDAPFWKPGTLWRNRYFSHEVVSETSEGHSLSIGVCIPYLNRNALLHAEREGTSGSSRTESGSLKYVQDPTTYRYWTYDFVMHWAGGLEVMNGRPYPKDGNPVWVEIENYNPFPCSDFADQGSWIPALPADFTWLIHPQANVWQMSGGGGRPPYQAYSRTEQGDSSEKGKLQFSIFDDPRLIHNNIPANTYFLGSPDPIVGAFYRDACKAVFGSAVYANVSENEGEGRKRWGYTRLADHKSAHHFIGVINE